MHNWCRLSILLSLRDQFANWSWQSVFPCITDSSAAPRLQNDTYQYPPNLSIMHYYGTTKRPPLHRGAFALYRTNGPSFPVGTPVPGCPASPTARWYGVGRSGASGTPPPTIDTRCFSAGERFTSPKNLPYDPIFSLFFAPGAHRTHRMLRR